MSHALHLLIGSSWLLTFINSSPPSWPQRKRATAGALVCAYDAIVCVWVSRKTSIRGRGRELLFILLFGRKRRVQTYFLPLYMRAPSSCAMYFGALWVHRASLHSIHDQREICLFIRHMVAALTIALSFEKLFCVESQHLLIKTVKLELEF
jgi:hypothetical protein